MVGAFCVLDFIHPLPESPSGEIVLDLNVFAWPRLPAFGLPAAAPWADALFSSCLRPRAGGAAARRRPSGYPYGGGALRLSRQCRWGGGAAELPSLSCSSFAPPAHRCDSTRCRPLARWPLPGVGSEPSRSAPGRGHPAPRPAFLLCPSLESIVILTRRRGSIGIRPPWRPRSGEGCSGPLW